MNLNIKKPALSILILLIAVKLLAQSADPLVTTTKQSFRTWSIGVYGASLSGYSILQSKADWRTQTINAGYGAYIKKQVLPSLGFEVNFTGGQIGGSNPVTNNTFTSYKTNISYAIDLNVVYTFANINFQHNQRAIQPYISAGIGSSGYKPQLFLAGVATNFKTGGAQISELYIPAGAGIKFNVSDNVAIDLGYTVNFMYSDNIDGFKIGGNNDQISYGHLGVEFSLGKRSNRQLTRYNRAAVVRAEKSTRERVLSERAQAKLDDDEQIKKNQAAVAAANLSVQKTAAKTSVPDNTDSDNDGVYDRFDKCPNTPAGTKVDATGCPLPVVVKPETKTAVATPEVKPVIKPLVVPPITAKSPEVKVTDADKKVAIQTAKAIAFENGKTKLLASSYPGLVRIANLIIAKRLSLKIAGFTDNVGSEEANVTISQARADAVKNYLLSIGVEEKKLDAFGYGGDQPVGSNKTPAGRKLNRRVEFTLFYQTK